MKDTSLTVLGEASLCQQDQQSCGACCWGRQQTREQLAPVLERNRVLFQQITSGTTQPTRWQLLWHELRSRRGRDLWWALLLWVPWIGGRLKQKLSAELVCAFVAFDSADQQRVGCLLHPLRHSGTDRRRLAAFRLLRNVSCSLTDWVCDGCHRYNSSTESERQAFRKFAGLLDWFNYSVVVQAWGARLPLPFEKNGQQQSPREVG